MTGFWKTDRNVTLGQLHFLGPANGHTHTLSMHCSNTRLSCLVCFSRVDFADRVKPQLRQWDPWRALDGRYGSDIHPCVSETSHRPSRLVRAYDWLFLDSWLLQTVQLGSVTCLWLPTRPNQPTQFLIHAIRDITVVLKKVA